VQFYSEAGAIITPRPRYARGGSAEAGTVPDFPSLHALLPLFFTLKFISCMYDSWTPGYAVAHPAYPVGPPLHTGSQFIQGG
jgi:hypothetical protein